MASKSVGLLNIAFGADLRGFEKAMKKAQRKLKQFGKSMKRAGKTMTTSLTMPILALGAVSVRAFDKQAKAIAQVEAGLKSTGNQVGKTSKELQKMASDLQSKTIFGDEEILQGATAQLLTFTNIAGDQFERTQVVALDLATRLDGDLKSSSIMLGKALNDPVANLSALSRAGIQFSVEQKNLVKSLVETNNLAAAQDLILEELENQYGGSAEAAALAGMGPIQQLNNALMDITEQIGERLLPHLLKVVKWVKKMADKFDNMSDSGKDTAVKVGLLVAALGPLLILIGQISFGISALIPVFTTLNAVMTANPVGAIIVGIALLIGAFYWLMTSSSETARGIKNAFIFMANSMINSINQIITGLNMINPFKQIPLIEQFTYIAKKELEEVGSAAKDAGEELSKLGGNLDMGGGEDSTKKGDLTKEQKEKKKELDKAIQEGRDADADAYNELLQTKAEMEDEYYQSLLSKEQQELNAVEDKYFSIIETAKAAGEDVTTLEESKQAEIDKIVADATQKRIDNEEKAAKESERISKEELDNKTKGWRAFSEVVGKIMNSIGNLQSAQAEQAQARFDIWKEEQEQRKDTLDGEMESQLERIEQSGMNEERKKEEKEKIEEEYAEKKAAIDERIEKKEKAMKRRQAQRDKAMKIASAIMSTADAVAANIAIPPLAAMIGALGAIQVATIASTPIPFAKGGLVTGATLGLIGEGSGTSAFNPEVVSPLDKLMGMMGATDVDVHGRIEGNNIVLVSDKAEISRQRFI